MPQRLVKRAKKDRANNTVFGVDPTMIREFPENRENNRELFKNYICYLSSNCLK
jgi:hypothetical protein